MKRKEYGTKGKVYLSLAIAKFIKGAIRLLRHGGTVLPGEVALRFFPGLPSVLSQNMTLVVVTGTNGKTTSCRMIEQAFLEAGMPCIANRSGSNMLNGIVTVFIQNSKMNGEAKKKYAVLECDEAWCRKVLPLLKPEVLLVTNLFRDQVDRFGSVESPFSAIYEGLRHSPETTVCLNAEDAVSAALSHDLPNPVSWYGLGDAAGENQDDAAEETAVSCILCGAPLQYRYQKYEHLGDFFCPSCGYKRRPPQICAEAISEQTLSGTTFTLRTEEETRTVTVNQPALYNVYNAVGAFAAATAAGVSPEPIITALASFDCGFGRMEPFSLGEKGAQMVLIKNAAGANQVLSFLSKQTEAFQVVLLINNAPADGTDSSWIEETRFELLTEHPALKEVFVGGSWRNR